MVMEKTSGKIRLGDAASFINGFAFKPDHWGDVGRPIIRIQNLNNTERSSIIMTALFRKNTL